MDQDMPVGTEVDLGPAGHIVLDGDPAPRKGAPSAPSLFSAHAYVAKPNGNWTLRLRDISPTRHSAYDMDTSPTGHFAYWTVSLMDSSPTRQFAYDMDISPTRHFAANHTTRQA